MAPLVWIICMASGQSIVQWWPRVPPIQDPGRRLGVDVL
jgi:hypothetical protein